MKFQAISTAAVFFAVFTAASAQALTHKTGVIKSVDLSSNTLVVTGSAGRDAEYRLAPTTRILVDGQEQNLSALAPQQQVTVAIPSSAPEYVHAEIIEMDQQTGLALVKLLDSKDTVTVRVNAATKISGKANSIGELSEGQKIKMRYAANI